ncbi:hypothetical protein CO038_00345 [Candidatus Pacearchaeota archaeon CG_4_9_14_0_2_um_filter_39_13]|nr:MFS transporter [Candidatus Pacearchaeota archaeon]OIO44011.1 MAG: hypothetical protein AUJ64_00910 [Candidatus Pacearchaeota archaeon CG1_02_39_14]PJC45123.1 MAG: hypothetical protein CO038_00345 [Candidatus Pacearchaeota archaeon CG_4_9_14_0_2_um_filter_39_13]
MKKGLKFLLVADSLATLALGMLGPIYAIFVEQIGGDILDASWAFFAFTLTSGVVIYIIGKWEDKIKHKEKLISSGYFLVALGCLGYILVYNQISLLGVQVILGFAIALLSPAYDSLYSHYVRKKEEASDWGSWEAMGYIVSAFAALIGGYIASQLGFKALFFVMFLFALFGAFASLSLFRSKNYLNTQ